MTAPLLIKITSASFKGVALVAPTQASVQVTGSEQNVRGGGAFAIQQTYVEGIHVKATVNCLQGQITDMNTILPGNGALTIVGFLQADGEGSVGGGAKTWTFPNATLTNNQRGIPMDGNPSVDYNFTVSAASGDPADLFTVA